MRGVGSAITRFATIVHFTSSVSPMALLDRDRIVFCIGVRSKAVVLTPLFHSGPLHADSCPSCKSIREEFHEPNNKLSEKLPRSPVTKRRLAGFDSQSESSSLLGDAQDRQRADETANGQHSLANDFAISPATSYCVRLQAAARKHERSRHGAFHDLFRVLER